MSTWYARPVFFVSDCAQAVAFYQRLGFEEQWRHTEGQKLLVVQMELNGMELILNAHPEKAGHGRLFVSLNRGEVQRFLATLHGKDIAVQDLHWGMPTKAIQDPDGNELVFFDDSLISKS